MNVLFFTYDFPYPTTSGGKNRAYNMLKQSAKTANLHLFSFVRNGFDERYIKNIKEIGVDNISVFKRKAVKDPRNIFSIFSLSNSIFKSLYFDRKVLIKLVQYAKDQKIDIIVFESYYTAFYISSRIGSLGIKQIYGTENLEYIIYEDYVKHIASPWQKPLLVNELRKIRNEEYGMLRNSDANLAVAEIERDYISKISGKPCFVIENGVDTDYFNYRPNNKLSFRNILFVGNFSYFPNVDAMNFFHKEVFQKLNDDFNLLVIGKNSKNLPFANRKRVTCIDYVKDIREEYLKAGVFISPIRIGGGTNFKILEAMAVGVPVVANPARLEGLSVIENEHILMARNAEEFALKIRQLFDNLDLRDRVTMNARAHVEKKFSWDNIGKNLSKVYKEVIENK